MSPRKKPFVNPIINLEIGPFAVSMKKRSLESIIPIISNMSIYEKVYQLNLMPKLTPKFHESWECVSRILRSDKEFFINVEDAEFFLSLADILGIESLKTQVLNLIEYHKSINIVEKCKDLEPLIQLQEALLNLNENNLNETKEFITNFIDITNDLDYDVVCNTIITLYYFQITKRTIFDQLLEILNLQFRFTEIKRFVEIKNQNKIKFDEWIKISQTNEFIKLFSHDNIDLLNKIATNVCFNINEKIKIALPGIENIYYSHSLICLAAYFDATKCFNFLEINNAEFDPNILIQYAVIGGNPDIIHFCESCQCKYNNLLSFAIIHHHNEIVEWLYENKNGRSFKPNLIDLCISKNNFYALSYLLRNNCNFSNDITNNSLLQGNVLLAKFTLKILGRSKYSDQNEWVFCACESGNLNAIEFALNEVGDKFEINDSTWNPLNFSCSIGNFEMYKLIKEANPKHIFRKISTTFDKIPLKFNGFIAELGVSKPALDCAIRGRNIDIIRDVIISLDSKELNQPMYNGYNALCCAIDVNNKDIIHLLLENDKIDINANQVPEKLKDLNYTEDIMYHENDPQYIAPLHVACKKGEKDVVQLLLQQKNIDINAISITHKNAYFTPLHFAVFYGHVDIVNLLLSCENIKPDKRAYIKTDYVNFIYF
ncbi:hypothetical protein TRFO_04446 [Tritrichomonas foetus]|uniref:DUF3447 domain-containing protein n=1 Tax=Tritrichomonas foetus TaxID=1144522 RepID=A0A1J4KG32_9EUKA|nr:hypothetical protein TRFO_04446 [Tritrichomonas foetus]|eukprot:OHT09896.1 hypothetical protein TRFO_04446 [Tritrichomonas foetus]